MMGSLSNPVNLARADFIICVGMLGFHHVSRTLVWFLDSDQEMGTQSSNEHIFHHANKFL
jgi:hypothetical protein